MTCLMIPPCVVAAWSFDSAAILTSFLFLFSVDIQRGSWRLVWNEPLDCKLKSLKVILFNFGTLCTYPHRSITFPVLFFYCFYWTGDCVVENDTINFALNLTEEPKERASCTADFTYKGYPVNLVSMTWLLQINVCGLDLRALISLLMKFKSVLTFDRRQRITNVRRKCSASVSKSRCFFVCLSLALMAGGLHWSDITTATLPKVNTKSSSGRLAFTICHFSKSRLSLLFVS